MSMFLGRLTAFWERQRYRNSGKEVEREGGMRAQECPNDDRTRLISSSSTVFKSSSLTRMCDNQMFRGPENTLVSNGFLATRRSTSRPGTCPRSAACLLFKQARQNAWPSSEIRVSNEPPSLKSLYRKCGKFSTVHLTDYKCVAPSMLSDALLPNFPWWRNVWTPNPSPNPRQKERSLSCSDEITVHEEV